MVELVLQLPVYPVLAVLDLGEVDINELLVHTVPFPESMEVDVAPVGLNLNHVSKEQQDYLLVDLVDVSLRDEQSGLPKEQVLLVE